MSTKWVVLKFGGTSVSSRARWETIASVMRERIAEGLRPVVVCSAVSQISNAIERLLDEAMEHRHEAVLDEIEGRHRELAAELGIDLGEVVGEELAELRRIALGVSLVRDAAPSVQARAMALGELISTKVGTSWLRSQGMNVGWQDARELLVAGRDQTRGEVFHYLNASCDTDRDEEMEAKLAALPVSAIITQGFIARDPEGNTVLLGRGGSDTSAALLASRLGAERVEIWTDVPGMFTANPRQIASARLLRRLGYREAQELASTGASVLHPKCIKPLRRHKIPLHVRDTNRPDFVGTVISADPADTVAQVKAVAVRKDLTLISMDTLGMWQQVGFLSTIFGTFAEHGMSVGLVATSESNVTVSLDAPANTLDPIALRALIEDLEEHCEVQLIENTASISLVGKNIRSILHRLTPAFEIFEGRKLHLLNQSASDINLSFVMDEEAAEPFAAKLHAQLFGDRSAGGIFGPSWRELELQDEDEEPPAPERWWRKKAQTLVELAGDAGTPLYVYDEETLRDSVSQIRSLPLDRVFYAIKANWNEEILRLFEAQGLGFECVSPGELDYIRRLFPKLPSDRILFTPNFAPAAEYVRGYELGAHVTLDNLFPLQAWPGIFAGKDLLVRIDPGQGDGHHHHVKTAGAYSKFGIPVAELPEVAEIAAKHDVRIRGVHAHVGSGILDPQTWMRNALFLIRQAQTFFPDAKIINLGGGLGIVERPAQEPLDLEEVASSLQKVRDAHPDYELWMEPGRFMVGGAGVLLGRVSQLKQKGDQAYIGIDAGMNSLIRPALYSAYHEIANLSRLGERATIRADVVGPICESGDVLGHERYLPQPQEGDVILIATSGAYGRTMGSRYNMREPAKEHFLR